MAALLRRSHAACMLPPCALPAGRDFFQTGLRPEPHAGPRGGPFAPLRAGGARIVARPCLRPVRLGGGQWERAFRSANRRRRAERSAAVGEDRARARSFSAGSGTSYRPAFPSVPGSGIPLARAKRPEGQGEAGYARRPVRGPRCPLPPPERTARLVSSPHAERRRDVSSETGASPGRRDGSGGGGVLVDGASHGVVVVWQFHRRVGVARCDARESVLVVPQLEVSELQSVGGGHDHHPGRAIDLALVEQFDQRRQRDPGVRTVVHAGAIGPSGRLGQLDF